MSDAPILSADGLHTFYGESHILQGVSLAVQTGSVLAVLGRNGAGKTTTLRSILRMTPPRRGTVSFDGRELTGMRPHKIAKMGVALVPEARCIFPSLSVAENLSIAARPGAQNDGVWTVERAYETFPALADRRHNGGATLSGGEQQMLAIARALVSNPRLLLMDEPSEGLAPRIVEDIHAILQDLRREGLTMLLVEQNYALATEVADRIVVLGKGRVRWEGTPAELDAADEVKHTWIGV